MYDTLRSGKKKEPVSLLTDPSKGNGVSGVLCERKRTRGILRSPLYARPPFSGIV